jgi:hypothetical protein
MLSSESDPVAVENHHRTAFVHALDGKPSGQFCHISCHPSCPVAICIGARIAMGGRNRLQVLQNTQSHARGMPLLRKAATLNHVIA